MPRQLRHWQPSYQDFPMLGAKNTKKTKIPRNSLRPGDTGDEVPASLVFRLEPSQEILEAAGGLKGLCDGLQIDTQKGLATDESFPAGFRV
jgi:hypothetical protein